mgnify:CR=1 FL=1
MKQKGTPNASLVLNDDEVVVKKTLCCFNKKIKKVYASQSERKVLLEKNEKQRKIDEANKNNKSLSSRMSSEYFYSVGGKSMKSSKQFNLRTESDKR